MPKFAAKQKKSTKFRCVNCKFSFEKKKIVKRSSGRLMCVRCNAKHPETGCCVTCDKRFNLDGLIKCPDTFMLYCEDHAPGKRKKKIEKSDTFGWYVMQVEPGKEGIVKKNLARKLRIAGQSSLLKRCIIARHFQDMIVPKRGEVIATEGGFANKLLAIQAAKAKCQQIFHETGIEHRYSAFPDKAEEKGKESNTWQYRISTIPEEKELRTVGVKKYPGYLICKLDFTPEFTRILKQVPMQWGMLLAPIHQNFLISVSYSKRYDKWKWMVKQDGKTVVAESTPMQMQDTREAARTCAEEAKAKLMEFKPIPLASEEAARELLNQQIFNEVSKNPAERDKAIVNFRVGSEVEVIEGTYKGIVSKVLKIDRSDKVKVKVWIEILVLGHPVPYELDFWQLKTISY